MLNVHPLIPLRQVAPFSAIQRSSTEGATCPVSYRSAAEITFRSSPRAAAARHKTNATMARLDLIALPFSGDAAALVPGHGHDGEHRIRTARRGEGGSVADDQIARAARFAARVGGGAALVFAHLCRGLRMR